MNKSGKKILGIAAYSEEKHPFLFTKINFFFNNFIEYKIKDLKKGLIPMEAECSEVKLEDESHNSSRMEVDSTEEASLLEKNLKKHKKWTFKNVFRSSST